MTDQITPDDHEPQDQNEHRRWPWKNIGIAFSALAIVILFSVYYVGILRVIHMNKRIASSASTLDTSVSQNQADINQLQKNITDLQQNLQQARDDIAAERNTMADLKNAYQSKSDDWTIADAQYLVKTADVNLELGDNVALVIHLLQAANQELSNVSDPKVVPLRKALADDILSLQAVPAQDTTGTYLQLNALNAEVDKLPLDTPRPVTHASELSRGAPWWKRGWQTTLNSLQKIVIVRYNEPGVRPFILPDEQELLYQNIHAMFYQAMTAVVHKQPEIYNASLLQAKTWIEKYFQPNSPLTQTSLKEIEKLQAINLHPTLPTLSSVQAFHDYAAAQQTGDASSSTPVNKQ
jgi:uroporphyrin-3 C-methyltransferase